MFGYFTTKIRSIVFEGIDEDEDIDDDDDDDEDDDDDCGNTPDPYPIIDIACLCRNAKVK